MADEPNQQIIPINAVAEEFVLLADYFKQRLLGRAAQVDALKTQLAAVTEDRDALKPKDKVN